VGKSQLDECDPVFTWLRKNNGITANLAWQRIRLAMEAGNPRLSIYLARFIPADQRRWLENWQAFIRSGYRGLERASGWPDNEITRMITTVSVQRLARKDADLAAQKFTALDGHFKWGEADRVSMLRDIALYAAVELDDDTSNYMAAVPLELRDSQLLEWWTRFLLSTSAWTEVSNVIEQMPLTTRSDERWRYWLAQAELRSGVATPTSDKLLLLSEEANYYGFLAADELGLPYNICPLQPNVVSGEVTRIAALDDFRRALELRKVGLDNWSIQEWSLAAQRVPVTDLKAVAALARRENWHDRVVFALGNSGDLQFYEWRFPLLWETEIRRGAAVHKLDPAWVYGTIRSESAMLETAVSSANAMGLMQVTPATGKRVSKRHGISWRGSAQLRTAAGNLPVGMAYMSDLLKDYDNNPVLVSAAYNAGPKAVSRWLDKRPAGEAAIWVETLPYFETRDYIPRVLAFSTLYDWRLGGPVRRISGRMPRLDSGKINISGTASVVCRVPD
jgi:soluble lytic murein transglycosylase